MRGFRKYTIWELSHQLTLDVYTISKSYPKSEIYGITSQLRRASSIPTNIAEEIVIKNLTDFLPLQLAQQTRLNILSFYQKI